MKDYAFVGDAVLGLLASRFLVSHSDKLELKIGIANAKSVIVSNKNLALYANHYGLMMPDHVRSEKQIGTYFEALIGYVYNGSRSSFDTVDEDFDYANLTTGDDLILGLIEVSDLKICGLDGPYTESADSGHEPIETSTPSRLLLKASNNNDVGNIEPTLPNVAMSARAQAEQHILADTNDDISLLLAERPTIEAEMPDDNALDVYSEPTQDSDSSVSCDPPDSLATLDPSLAKLNDELSRPFAIILAILNKECFSDKKFVVETLSGLADLHMTISSNYLTE